ncbi:MAG: EVE domain-containing protein [Ignavibacteriales bacterium]|nr:EVE domain-containing protein [Ignavibacteriales bacterium]
MHYFLMKTEPSVYSFADLEQEKKTVWNGVSNYAALKHMRSMKREDLVFIYHSGDEKQVVGIAKVIAEAYQDPKEKDEKMIVVDIQAFQKLKNPVTLTTIKSRKEFKDFSLVRIPRLSVMPVPAELWEAILALSK